MTGRSIFENQPQRNHKPNATQRQVFQPEGRVSSIPKLSLFLGFGIGLKIVSRRGQWLNKKEDAYLRLINLRIGSADKPAAVWASSHISDNRTAIRLSI